MYLTYYFRVSSTDEYFVSVGERRTGTKQQLSTLRLGAAVSDSSRCQASAFCSCWSTLIQLCKSDLWERSERQNYQLTSCRN